MIVLHIITVLTCLALATGKEKSSIADHKQTGNTKKHFQDNDSDSCEKISKIVNEAKTTWKAGCSNKTTTYLLGVLDDLNDRKLPLKKPIKNTASQKRYGANLDLPIELDLRLRYPECPTISSIKDQSNCASSWAVSTAAVFSDRICIATNGAVNVNISAENLLACCSDGGNGCQGGYLRNAWECAAVRGIVSGGDHGSNEGCQPYSIEPCGGPDEPSCDENTDDTPTCRFYCTNPHFNVMYRHDIRLTKNAFYMARNMPYIQQEIMNKGPLAAHFFVYADFFTYKSGVYVHTTGRQVGGHAARIIGWGREDGKDYWLAANSWGKSWGENGTFKILRGSNHCEIESFMTGGAVETNEERP